jgi:mRNA-degrading endonuclease HigB of HigAB toxin-antitoxin module
MDTRDIRQPCPNHTRIKQQRIKQSYPADVSAHGAAVHLIDINGRQYRTIPNWERQPTNRTYMIPKLARVKLT